MFRAKTCKIVWFFLVLFKTSVHWSFNRIFNKLWKSRFHCGSGNYMEVKKYWVCLTPFLETATPFSFFFWSSYEMHFVFWPVAPFFKHKLLMITALTTNFKKCSHCSHSEFLTGLVDTSTNLCQETLQCTKVWVIYLVYLLTLKYKVAMSLKSLPCY